MRVHAGCAWRGLPEPLFTAAEASRAIAKWRPLAYSEPVTLEGLRLTAWSAGRCLGSAAWLIESARPDGVAAVLYVGAGAAHQLTLIGPGALGSLAVPPKRLGWESWAELRLLRHPKPLDLPAIRAELERSKVKHLTLVFGSQLRPDTEDPTPTTAPGAAAGGEAAPAATEQAAAEDDQVGRAALGVLRHVSGALAAGGVAVVAIGQDEPLFCVLDLVELLRCAKSADYSSR